MLIYCLNLSNALPSELLLLPNTTVTLRVTWSRLHVLQARAVVFVAARVFTVADFVKFSAVLATMLW